MPDPDSGFPNDPKPVDEQRRQRCFVATDSEWHMICKRARRADLTTSQFLIDRALDNVGTPLTATSPPTTLPGVQRRLALSTLVVARIEEMRMQELGDAETWDRLVAEESAFLDSEDIMGPDPREG